MKEIKFRGLNSLGCWFYGGYYYDKELDEHRIITDSIDHSMLCHSKDVIGGTIGFKIGMKDVNGRDIYVGDIVNCGNWRNDIVEFKNGSVWLKYRDITLHRHVNDLHKTVEVIGNIFENRELLSIRKKFYSITGEKYYLKLDFKEDLIKEIERIDPESVRRELLSIHKENCRSVAYFNASTKELEFYSSPSKDQILRQEHLILLDLLYEDRNPYLKHYPVFDLERIKEDVELLLYQL